MSLIIGVDASGGKDGNVNALQEAGIGQVECADDIVSDSVLLVILAPIDIWAAGGSSSVEDVCRLDSLQLGNDSLAVLHAHSGRVNLLSCDMLDLWESLRQSSDK